MYSNPLGPSEKNSLCWKLQRNARYVRSLGKKNPFWGHTQRLKNVSCTWSGALKMLPRGPQMMQIPRGYQKKCLLCRKTAILSVRLKFHFWWGMGWGGTPPLTKSAHFGCNGPQHKSTSDSVWGTSNKSFWRYSYRIWRYSRDATLFQGLN